MELRVETPVPVVVSYKDPFGSGQQGLDFTRIPLSEANIVDLAEGGDVWRGYVERWKNTDRRLLRLSGLFDRRPTVRFWSLDEILTKWRDRVGRYGADGLSVDEIVEVGGDDQFQREISSRWIQAIRTIRRENPWKTLSFWVGNMLPVGGGFPSNAHLADVLRCLAEEASYVIPQIYLEEAVFPTRESLRTAIVGILDHLEAHAPGITPKIVIGLRMTPRNPIEYLLTQIEICQNELDAKLAAGIGFYKPKFLTSSQLEVVNEALEAYRITKPGFRSPPSMIHEITSYGTHLNVYLVSDTNLRFRIRESNPQYKLAVPLLVAAFQSRSNVTLQGIVSPTARNTIDVTRVAVHQSAFLSNDTNIIDNQ